MTRGPFGKNPNAKSNLSRKEMQQTTKTYGEQHPLCPYNTAVKFYQSTSPSHFLMRSRSLVESSSLQSPSRPPIPATTGGDCGCRNIRPARFIVKTRSPKARATFGRLPVASVSLDSASAGGGDIADATWFALGSILDPAGESSLAAVTEAAPAGGQGSDAMGPPSSSRTSNACIAPEASRTKKTAGLCSDQATDETAAAGQLLLLMLSLVELETAVAEKPPSHTLIGPAKSSWGVAVKKGERGEMFARGGGDATLVGLAVVE